MSENTLLVEVEKRELLNPEPSYYQMDNATRGYCVIINFTKKTNAEGKTEDDRAGAVIDEKNVIKTFEQFGFKIETIINQSHTTIEKELKKYAAAVPRDHQCLFLFLMAHGGVFEKEEVFTDIDGKHTMEKKDHVFKDIDGRIKSSEYISDAFNVNNCVELAGKPKVFVIQTCFGSNLMIGPLKKPRKEDPKPHSKEGDAIATVKQHEALDKLWFPEAIGERTIIPHKPHIKKGDAKSINADPPHKTSDMFWFRATIDGYKAYRSPTQGSYFIRDFCEAMRQLKKSDLHTICTQVQSKVKCTTMGELYRQQPEICSRLNKKLMFNPGLDRIKSYSKPPSFPRSPPIQRVEGSYIWPVNNKRNDRVNIPDYVVVKSNSPVISWYSGQYNKTIKPDRGHIKDFIGFKAGISIADNTHLVILKMIKGFKATLITTMNTDLLWKSLEAHFGVHSPLALCEVNNDGIGILCGVEKVYDKADFYIFSRKGILNETKPEQKEHAVLAYKLKAEDLVTYHKATIYIASMLMSSVLVFDFKSEEPQPQSPMRCIDIFGNIYGYYDMPCMIGIDEGGIIVVDRLGISVWNTSTQGMDHVMKTHNIEHMWYNSKHVVLAQKKKVLGNTVNVLPPKPTFTNKVKSTYEKGCDAIWITKDGGIVLAENNINWSVIHIVHSHETKTRISVPPDKGAIMCGLATSLKEHVIITNSKEQMNNLWRFNTDGAVKFQMDQVFQENYQPLKVFDINQKSYGIIRQEPTKSLVAIEIRNTLFHNQEKLLHIHHQTLTQYDAVCYTPNREFYITNCRKGNILQYDEDGTFIRSFGKPGALHLFNSIFVDRHDIIYVLCQEGMYSFDRTTGKWLRIEDEITEPKMGCYDHKNMFILYSGEMTSVTTYDILSATQSHVEENKCNLKETQTSNDVKNEKTKTEEATRADESQAEQIKGDLGKGETEKITPSKHEKPALEGSRAGQKYKPRSNNANQKEERMTAEGLKTFIKRP